MSIKCPIVPLGADKSESLNEPLAGRETNPASQV